jgi:CO/xanthine dehydrogenase Mo-binding subunit
VPLEKVKVVLADTLTTPDSGTTTASRTTYAVGNAIMMAAEKLRAQLKKGAVGLQGLSVRETFHIPVADMELGEGLPHLLYSYGTHVALVEVNTLTGEVEVLAVEAYLDGGRVIFRTGFEGQSEGGVAQGIGYALFEEVLLDGGRFLNTNFNTYIMPTSLDVPADIRTVPVEVKEKTGPFGAKGISETCMVGVTPAILNALQDAIGVRFTRLPVRAEDVLRALGEQRR